VKGGLAALVVTGAVVALPAIAAAGPTDPGGVCTVPKRLGIVFVVDDSGSMADNDPNALRGAATTSGSLSSPTAPWPRSRASPTRPSRSSGPRR
jgi:hypothetical protein